MVGSNIHVAEQLPCLLNHIAIRQREETALVPLSGSLLTFCRRIVWQRSLVPLDHLHVLGNDRSLERL